MMIWALARSEMFWCSARSKATEILIGTIESFVSEPSRSLLKAFALVPETKGVEAALGFGDALFSFQFTSDFCLHLPSQNSAVLHDGLGYNFEISLALFLVISMASVKRLTERQIESRLKEARKLRGTPGQILKHQYNDNS